MIKHIYLSLVVASIALSCQKKEEVQSTRSDLIKRIEESPKGLEYDDILKIVLEYDNIFNKYEVNEEEKIVSDLSNIIALNTEVDVEKNYDVPEIGTIYVRKVFSETTGKKDAFTTSFVDIPSDRIAKKHRCESQSTEACGQKAILETIKTIISEKRETNIYFKRGVCRTLSWTFLDCTDNQ
jgi:hypothetical protein